MPRNLSSRFDPDDVAEDRAERKADNEQLHAEAEEKTALASHIKSLGGNRTLHFTMDLDDALQLGLIICACGHPTNNHFLNQDGRPCAHCKCTKLQVIARRGTLKEANDFKAP